MKRIGSLFLLVFLFQTCGQNHNGDPSAVSDSSDSLLQAGREYLEKGMPEKAIQLLKTVDTKTTDELRKSELAEIKYLLGKSYYEYEENELAAEKIQEAFTIFYETGNIKRAAETLLLQGEIALYLSDQLQADSCFAQAIELASSEQYPVILFEALIKRSSTIFIGKRNTELLERAFEVAEAMEDKPKQIQVCQLLASEYEATGKLSLAEIYYLKLIKLKSNDPKAIALIPDIRSLGGIYEKTGSFGLAQEQYIKALDIAEFNQDTLLLAGLFTEISALFIQSQTWDKVEEYAQKAIQIVQEADLNLQHILAKNLNYLGLVNENKADKNLAGQYYRRSLDLFQQLSDHLNSAKLNLQLARLDNAPSRLEAALQDYSQALRLKQANNEKVGIMQVKMNIADILLLQDKPDEALTYLLESERIAREINAKDDLSKIYQGLALIYGQKKTFEKAFTYQQLSSALKDSILTQKIMETTIELEVKYNFDKQELEIAQQQLANREIQIQNKKLQFQIGLVSLLGLSLVLLLSAYIWRRRQLHRQKILMLEKEKETQVLRSIITGEENERKRIARELHDGIGALLSTVKMQFGSLSGFLPEIKKQDRFKKADALLDDACEEVRRISHNMMPGVLEHYGLEFALRELCQNIAHSFTLEIDFISHGLDKVKDETLSLSIYRIIQELLKNVVQHANATEVIVQTTLEDNYMNIVVEDDGQGFDQQKIKLKKGIGLENIQSRVTFLGGTIDIQSEASQGSSFMIVIPVIAPTKTPYND